MPDIELTWTSIHRPSGKLTEEEITQLLYEDALRDVQLTLWQLPKALATIFEVIEHEFWGDRCSRESGHSGPCNGLEHDVDATEEEP